MHELLAASALMRSGYEVSFPVDRSGPVDLYAIRGRRCHRVQVKTASHWDKALTVRTKAKGYVRAKLDYLVVVGPSSEVWKIPWQHAKGRETIRLHATKPKWRIA